MKRVFDLNKIDDFQKSFYAQVAITVFFMLQLLYVEITRRSLFEFISIATVLFFVFLLRFYFSSRIERNYSFWGISILFLIVILKNIIEFTFFHYDGVVLYLNFLSLFFLLINCYIMSSPVFFPRIQWWEYDFRFRGDLKASFNLNEKEYPARLSDLRRQSGCVESFEGLSLDEEIKLKVKCHEYDIDLDIIIKTMTEVVVGRPKRYGFYISKEEENIKSYNKLKHFWDINKKVRMRSKFKDE